MATNETPRFRIPFPKENAESWYSAFVDTMSNVDSRMFDNLEHLNIICTELTTATIADMGGGVYHFIPTGSAKFLSRTHHVEIDVNSAFVELSRGALIGAVLQSGAVGPQTVEWEIWPGQMDIDADQVPLGYVTDDYSIIWFNGSVLEVGVMKRLFAFDDPSSFNGYGDVHVDITNGSDVYGTGSISFPYRTLAHAADEQPAPTNFATFSQPCRFIVASGTYSDNVIMPDRLKIEIIGDNFDISGDITWTYDVDSWFGEDPALEVSSLTFTAQSMHKSLISGDILMQNAVPASGGAVTRNLVVNQMEVSGSVWNYASGDDSSANRTGRVMFLVNSSKLSGGSLGSGATIGGEIEKLAAIYYPNPICLTAKDSQIMHAIYGCAEFLDCSSSSFFDKISWQYDITGSPGYTGVIGGVSADEGRSFYNCWFAPSITEITFGWYSKSSPQPAALPVSFDTVSFNSAHDKGGDADGRVTFEGWETDENPLVCSDDQVEDSVFRVPVGSSSPEYNGAALKETIVRAAKKSNLSADNRAIVLIPPGQYFIGEDPILLDTDYVDLLAMCEVGHGMIGANPSEGSVSIHGETYGSAVIVQTAEDVRMSGLTLIQTVNDLPCMLISTRSGAPLSVYEGMTFKDDGMATGVNAVMISDAENASYWKDCSTSLEGFLLFVSGGTLSGRMINCVGGAGSFAGNSDVSTEMNNSFTGYATDCVAADFSFGASNGGGNCTFSGVAIMCRISSSGFGSSHNGTGPYAVLCSGYFVDCVNGHISGGSASYGYCENGDATCNAYLENCSGGSYSYGCSGAAGFQGSFTGQAIDTTGDRYCFGSNSADVAEGWFGGRATRCSATRYSFGARGRVDNGSYLTDCEASYGSFGNATVYSGAAFLRCTCTGMSSILGGPIGLFGATLNGCNFSANSVNGCSPLMLNGDGTKIYRSSIQSLDGVSASVDASAAYTAKIAHCMMNVAIAVAVTNDIGTGYNVVDAAFEI